MRPQIRISEISQPAWIVPFHSKDFKALIPVHHHFVILATNIQTLRSMCINKSLIRTPSTWTHLSSKGPTCGNIDVHGARVSNGDAIELRRSVATAWRGEEDAVIKQLSVRHAKLRKRHAITNFRPVRIVL